MATEHEQVEALGAGAIGIATAAPFQARALLKKGHPFPLLIDRESRTYARLGIGRMSLARFLFDLRGWWRWLVAFAKSRRQGLITAGYSALSGVAVTDATGQVRYAYRARGLGDYPPLERVLAELRKVARP